MAVALHHRAQRAEAELARLHAQIARLQAERDALWWAVGHDELTGLPNRRLFYQLVSPLLNAGDHRVAVIVMDLNEFKPINDRLGHATGDSVLCVVAQRLIRWAGDNPVARLGGDEFAAVLTSAQQEQRDQWWRPALTALYAAIAEPMPAAGHTVTVTTSIGIAPVYGPSPIGDLLHRADLAMYETKQRMKVTGRSSAARGLDHSDIEEPRSPDRQKNYFELALFRASQHGDENASPPACEPGGRDPATVAAAHTYSKGDPVWVYRDGDWRAGVVETASAHAVMARYVCARGLGTAVDTMRAEYVASGTRTDPYLDQGSPYVELAA
jgi:diguanylate cyclase (GGDEF)-like protein